MVNTGKPDPATRKDYRDTTETETRTLQRHRRYRVKMTDSLIVNLSSPFATITLNRPKRGNALSSDMSSALIKTLKDLDKSHTEKGIQALILTGNGKYFCSGMDLSGATNGNDTPMDRFNNALDLFGTLSNLSIPTIAYINGPCLAGGVGLAFCCDVRICQDVTFTLSEVRRGLVAATISEYIIREWGVSKAREAMITGRSITASELYQIGAIHYLAKDEQDANMALERYKDMLLKSGPLAVHRSKGIVSAVAKSHSEGRQAIKAAFVEMMGPSDEAAHGIGQFLSGNKDVDWVQFYKDQKKDKSKL